MYTKEEASLVKQKFWTSFGKYMQPVPSASGEKVHWINYKTGIKGISFKMDADNNKAFVAIEFHHSDSSLQKQYFDVFVGLKKHFVKIVGKDWAVEEHYLTSENKIISCAVVELNGIKIFRESDWTAIITFFKQHIIALDQFWEEWKPSFEGVG